MNKILKDRARLIKAMILAKNSYIFKKNGAYGVVKEIISKIKSDLFDHYVSLYGNTTQKISYAKDSSNKLDVSKRTKTTLGRYIRRILKVSFECLDDYTLDTYCNEVSKYLVDITELDSQIKFLSGNQIVEHYKTSTSKSCMTGANAYKVSLYALNPDKVSLVVYEKNIRALLWTCDDGTKVLDRIYPACCAGVVLLTEWAKKKRFVRRSNPDTLGVFDRRPMEKLSDGSVRTITLKCNDTFPYMDTFKYLSDPKDNLVIVSNAVTDYHKFPYIALHTTGSLPWRSYICDCCGDEIDQDDLHLVDDTALCDCCYDENYSCCQLCDDVYHNDYIYYIDDIGEVCVTCRDNSHKQCNNCEKFIHNDNIKHINNEYYCEKCAVSKFIVCEDCGNYVPTDESKSLSFSFLRTGPLYCIDCFEKSFTHCYSCDEIFPKDEIKIIDNKCFCRECAANETEEEIIE